MNKLTLILNILESGGGRLFLWYENNKQLLLYSIGFTFVLGLIAHAFIYFNPSFSYDSLYIDYSFQRLYITNGRFFLLLYILCTGPLIISWFLGLLSLIFISLSVFFIVKLFKIKSKLVIFSISAIFTMNIVVTLLNATFIFQSGSNMFALFMGVLAVYITQKKKYGFLLGSLAICLLLGTYQAYISVPIGLAILLAMLMIINNQKLGLIFISIAKNGLTLLIGGLLYYIIWQMLLKINNYSVLSSYHGFDKLGDYSNINIVDLVINTYKIVFQNYLTADAPLGIAFLVTNIICFVYIVYAIISAIIKLKYKHVVILLILILIFPFSLNITNIISKGVLHELMFFSFCFIYLFMLLLYSNRQSEHSLIIPKFLLILFNIILIINGSIFSNTAYLKKKLEYDATLSNVTRIVDRIEKIDGYIAGVTPVLFDGAMSDNIYFGSYREIFSKYYKYIGLYFSTSLVRNIYNKEYFLYILNIPIKIIKNIDDYKNLEEVLAMPAFPHKDSVRMVDGVVIVKLNDRNE